MKRMAGTICLAVLFLVPVTGSARNLGIGGGLRYNVGIGSFSDIDFDRGYLSYLVSAKYQFPGLLAAEVTLDYYPGGKDVDYIIRPSAAVLLGDFINVGLGITSAYHKGGEDSRSGWGDLGYQLQAGLQLPLTSRLWLNADAYYFLQDLKEIKDFKSDYITLGARLHVRF